MDEEQGFGIPKTSYRSQDFDRVKREAKSEDDAMSYLRRALDTTPQVSASQGIASALLAAVPTIGGYLIGQSVGRPKTPEGFYFDNQKDMALMSNDAGVQGANAGTGLADAYLSEIAKRQELQRAQYLKMAELKAREEADQRDVDARAQNIRAQTEAQKELIPIEEASRMRIINAQRGDREPTMWDMFSPAQKQYLLERKSGATAEGEPVDSAGYSLDMAAKKQIAGVLTNREKGYELANELEQIPNMAEFLKLKTASALDPNGIDAKMKAIGAYIISDISGASVPVAERQNFMKMMFGDSTADPRMAAQTLRNFISFQEAQARNRLEVEELASTPEKLKERLAAPVATPTPTPTAAPSNQPPPGMNDQQFLKWFRENRGARQ